MDGDKRGRLLSIAVCSLLFAYLLSFVFEGRVFYSLLERFGEDGRNYVLLPIAAHLAGLLAGGCGVRSQRLARRVMALGMTVCLGATLPFFFPPSALWPLGLAAAGFAGGCAFASWGYFLKACTPKNQRLKTCAEVLIAANILMLLIGVAAESCSALLGLALSLLCLTAALVLCPALPDGEARGTARGGGGDINKPLLLLFVFVAVITVDSGLMYQVINPAFAHLTALTSWYWAVPYIAVLALIRTLPAKARRAALLYVGMAMIVAAFVCFMVLGRGAADYLIVDTLMLGACGIFDLFWWSIIGEMLEYTDNPARVSGIGLSANVFGVLCGDVIGLRMRAFSMPGAEIAVVALCVICASMALLPPLNRQLSKLLKNQAYLAEYSRAKEPAQSLREPTEPLTARERETLELILSGKSNREIAELLSVSENTVKTHVRNILAKYAVKSRAELISTLLRNVAAQESIR